MSYCNAPWDEKKNPERDFDVEVEQRLVKRDVVATDDYILDCDEDGRAEVFTYDTDWEDAYKRCHKTPLELIAELKAILEGGVMPEGRKLRMLLADCEGWQEEELNVEEQ